MLPGKSENYFEKLNIKNIDRHYIRRIVTSLSFAVILVVFWSLKLTGIGVAGEAFCGMSEHVHDTACPDPCPLEEHIHLESCYSNIYADLETIEDWDKLLADIARGPTVKENIVLVAQSQLGYKESTINFQVDALGIRRGITRYGQWYGNPYGDWSAMFVSFCLHYGGARNTPVNAGPEAMRLEWLTAELYKSAAAHTPEAGNLIFLDKTEDATQSANAVGIIVGIEGDTITVIEGDVDNTVVQVQYGKSDSAIMGYGMAPSPNAVIVVEPAPAGAENLTLWLDGTDGGLGHLTGSPDTSFTVKSGATVRLPAEWTSPSKYSYRLRGWYDVTSSRYYPAGQEMTVTKNSVLYADWVARTYDLGIYNAQVADTVSTNSFITTHMFDYNYLFNIHSSRVQASVNSTAHSETWSMVTSGSVAYNNQQTHNFIFIDNDSGGLLCMPNNRSQHNIYPGAGIVTPNIYTNALGQLLFATDNCYNPLTGSGVIGKTYLGTGDHLFQIMDDPSDEHYGYYYYDSKHNAASYNQSNSRFYVYEYLSGTSDAIGSTYSDFLPLNSPYANTNGKVVGTFTYAGVDGEYNGVTHYRYDSKYNSGNYNSVNNVQTDYAYGMRTDINFYLPNDPGTGGNKDLNGNDIVFEFTGDDDLWVLVDGQLVLDIGGIHGAEAGVIDFSTGQVTVQGKQQSSLMDLGIEAGDHTLSILYLERGSSLSNCSIYFNLVPRFGMEIKKEDVLTQKILNGAQFTVYTDFACTEPAELWSSEEAYLADRADGVLDQFQSTFTVSGGIARIWGFGTGNTYYIKETGPPQVNGYGLAQGVIQMTLDKGGLATYHVDVIADAEGNEPSKGFTVHGVNIDEKTQTVYIVVTNAPETVTETTTVQVLKKWMDNVNHSNDYIQAYLTVIESDGTVRRIREITLSDENEWNYTWTNLPKYDYDKLEEVVYGVMESYESGYYSTVRKITEISTEKIIWAEATKFITGESYLLRHANNGYLSTKSATDGKLIWVDEATAKDSVLALWTVTVSGTNVKFTNGAGQTLTFNSGSSSSSRYFHAVSGNASNQSLGVTDSGSGFRINGVRSNRKYYMSSLNTSTGRISTTTSTYSSMILTPIEKLVETDIREVTDWAYEITNTPLDEDNETSVSVQKDWNVPVGFDSSQYQESQITVRLLANGVDTGRTITLNLKNGWQSAFLGLPYKNENGEIILYTVREIWEKENWTVEYGQITASGGTPPEYSVQITNTFHPGGPLLPSTGSAARLMFTLCGWGIILGALVYGIGSRRKRERRMK